jgi:hypothetical protein
MHVSVSPRARLALGAGLLAALVPVGAAKAQVAATAQGARHASTTYGGSECALGGGETGIDFDGRGGAGLGDYPSCDFTVRSRGGYVANGSWAVDVRHADESVSSYGPGQWGSSQSCAPRGALKPGDRVHAVLYTGVENSASVFYVKLGAQYHCS